MIFINNKYTKWYINIVEKAKIRNSSDLGYGETHHIIPKSIGGKDNQDNLVWLTAKEHFICHLLLPKMVAEQKHITSMNYALFRMSHVSVNTTERYKINSNTYAIIKKCLSNACRDTHTGRKHTEESKIKRSLATKGKSKNRQNITPPWNKGIPMSESAKKKASEKLKGRVAWNKGIKVSVESNLKRIKKQTGVSKEKTTCPHCGKTGGKPAMKRHHFEKCKTLRISQTVVFNY